MENLNLFAKPIKAENNFIKASLGGFAGSGKSRTASELITGSYKKLKCNKPLLILDNEKGSRFLIPLFEKSGIETLLKETVELSDVIQAFNYLNNGDIDFLFIDSLTKIWYKYVRDYKLKNGKKSFMTLQDWGKILPSWQEQFADKFVNLTGNCIFTGRGGYTYDMEENDKGKKEFVKSGVKMKMAGETPFEPDLNIWMDIMQEIKNDKPHIWREALIMKDRSGLIDGKTFKNPTFNDFEPVIDYLINAPKGEVAKSGSVSNLAPSENYEYQNKKEKKEIELEKITNIFVKNDIGTSKEDKQLKLAILENIFNTISWKEIEHKTSDELYILRGQLEELFNLLPQNEDKLAFAKEYKPSFMLMDAKDLKKK